MNQYLGERRQEGFPGQRLVVVPPEIVAAASVPHFTTLCRKQTGMPPLGLLIRLRLQRAMHLLQHGNHNVAEAARAVGYEDPFYFSRLFKKHIGVAPSSCMHGP